jgi:hypothetical protein
MKNGKLITIMMVISMLVTFTAGLTGCKQEVSTTTPPANFLSVKEHHRLVYLGGNRVLDYDGGTYSIWVYDPSVRGSADPFVSKEAWGQWSSIDTDHKLIYMGNDRVLDWNMYNGDYRIWVYDRSIRGNHDPLPGSPEVQGNWSSIQISSINDIHDINLIYLGNDRLLEWHDNDGRWWI